jgi:peptidyl-prolyl cis-trans isomerase A (cyclophilin A)
MKNAQFLILLFGLLYSCSLQAKPKKPKLEPGIYAEISTSKGNILIALEYEKTPMTVANFVGLAEGKFKVFDSISFYKPYYNGLKFHRVIADFMIQGGDPDGNGSGGPGYKFYDEIVPELVHSGPGTLSMANAGAGTNGSQFFITHKATPHLNGRHTVFGHVITGQNIVDSIAQNDLIEKVEIIRVGKTARKWNATDVFNEAYNKVQDEMAEKERIEKAETAESQVYIDQIKGLSEPEFIEFMYKEVQKKFPEAKKSPSGLVYIIESAGEGEKAHAGDMLTVHYKGVFRNGEKQFDSSYDRGEPMQFKFKEQRMIPGFEEGLEMLGKGGKIKVMIPYFQAYGAAGRPGGIPPYSDLMFDIEVLDIQKSAAEHGPHDGHNH